MNMKRKIQRILATAVLAVTLITAPAAGAEGTEKLLENFTLNHGDRSSKKIAITIDDGYETEYYWKCAELCRQYGIGMTFFPIGLVLKEEDREDWIKVIESGCEIGSHSKAHNHLAIGGTYGTLLALGRFQEKLDATLGFHYEVRWLRPPFGKLSKDPSENAGTRNAIKLYGYDHIVLWDVSQTDPDKAIEDVQNGSILLYHTRKKDYQCIENLIPRLMEKGFELVTLSELFGFDPPETGGELYVYDVNVYKNKK